MEIYYTNETLYVKMSSINSSTINMMKKRLFRIVEGYGIDNIVLNTPKNFATSILFTPLIREYQQKHNGNLRII